jgi:HIV Tat-specific factor 1
MDDELLEQQQAVYAVPGVDESEPAGPQRKRKSIYTNGDEENDGSNVKKSKPTKEPTVRKNTAVYVTNLPTDIDVDEVHSVFSKCGVIAEEIDARKPRIKLYTDEQGSFKGEALIVYFRAESVDLAVQMLDETDFRFGEAGPSGKMKVQAADFSYKKQDQKEGGPPKSSLKDKKKIIKKTQKLNKYANMCQVTALVTILTISVANSQIGMTTIRRHYMLPVRVGIRWSY